MQDMVKVTPKKEYSMETDYDRSKRNYTTLQREEDYIR